MVRVASMIFTSPYLLAMSTVAISQHPYQGVRVIESLPHRNHFSPVLLKNCDLFFSEALVKIIDATLTINRCLCCIHTKLETASV
jgi:hypothetical protein